MSSMLPPKPPSFFKIMFTDFDKNMRIPPAFMKNFREGSDLRIPNIIKLKCAGKTWCVSTERKKYGCFLVSRWHKFAKECNLEFGDFLVFRLVDHSIFEVDVYGTSACEKVPPFAKNDDHKPQAPVGKPEEVIPGKGNAGKRRKAAETEGCSVKRARKAPKKMEAKSSSFKFTLKHENNRYQIHLPIAFTRETGLNSRENVVVKDPKGGKWPIKVNVQKIESTFLSTGWKKVWVANGLKIGDTILLKFNHVNGRIDLTIAQKGCRRRPNSGSVKAQIPKEKEIKGSSFAKLVLKHYTTSYINLLIEFARETGLMSKKSIVVKNPEGKTWTIGILVSRKTGHVRLSAGWIEFWRGNGFEIGTEILLKKSIHGADNEFDFQVLHRPNSNPEP